MDMEHVKRCLAISLARALADVVALRPRDPIVYLAHWLFRYREVTPAQQQEAEPQEAPARRGQRAKKAAGPKPQRRRTRYGHRETQTALEMEIWEPDRQPSPSAVDGDLP